jgi:hypothetical protein
MSTGEVRLEHKMFKTLRECDAVSSARAYDVMLGDNVLITAGCLGKVPVKEAKNG